ncbi:MAG: (d)CMP kinase [Dehalococcoidia bacterium]
MPPRNNVRARAPIVAIDGPGASGKTTVGLGLARRWGYRFIDTGVMYRAVTVLVLEQGVALDDGAALARLARGLSIGFGEQNSAEGPPKVFVDGRDFSTLIDTPEVDRAVSQVSLAAGVREALVRLQRRLASEGGVVMVGRDIGTVVLPEAGLKVFLEASAEERARRRHRERKAGGERSSYRAVMEDLQRRDQIDSQRAISPLAPAVDARRVETDGKTVEEVIDAICELSGAP